MELAALERLKDNVSTLSQLLLIRAFLNLRIDNKKMHNILDEFEFRPVLPTDIRDICPTESRNTPMEF